MVKILRFIVQMESIFVKDFSENIFKQKFLELTHKLKLQSLSIFPEKRKNSIFQTLHAGSPG